PAAVLCLMMRRPPRSPPFPYTTLFRSVRQRHPHLPVVLMTAYAEVGRAVEAMRAGACDFLLKPFEPKALLAHIEKFELPETGEADRKSTRLNSSHVKISYAVFCLKKKN